MQVNLTKTTTLTVVFLLCAIVCLQIIQLIQSNDDNYITDSNGVTNGKSNSVDTNTLITHVPIEPVVVAVTESRQDILSKFDELYQLVASTRELLDHCSPLIPSRNHNNQSAETNEHFSLSSDSLDPHEVESVLGLGESLDLSVAENKQVFNRQLKKLSDPSLELLYQNLGGKLERGEITDKELLQYIK